MDKPIPIPLLLLVKNGSKMRFNVSGSIPEPESSIATTHSPVSVTSDLSCKTREPAAVELMASMAFLTRLKNDLLQLNRIRHHTRQSFPQGRLGQHPMFIQLDV